MAGHEQGSRGCRWHREAGGARRSGAKKPQDWHRRPGDLASARLVQGRRRLWVAGRPLAAGRWCWRFTRGGRWTGSRRGVLRSAPPPLPCPGPAAPGNDADAIAQSGPRFPMGPRGIWGSAIAVTPPRIDASLRRRRASSVPRYPDPRQNLRQRRAQLSRTDRA